MCVCVCGGGGGLWVIVGDSLQGNSSSAETCFMATNKALCTYMHMHACTTVLVWNILNTCTSKVS